MDIPSMSSAQLSIRLLNHLLTSLNFIHVRSLVSKELMRSSTILTHKKDRQKSSHSSYQFPHVSNSLHISDVIINIKSVLHVASVYRQDRFQIKRSDLRTSARPPKSYVFHEFPSFRAFLTHYQPFTRVFME